MASTDRDDEQRPDDFGIGRLFWLTSEAIVGADLNTETIVLWNPAAERLFGYTSDEAVGMRLEVLVPRDLHDQHLAGIRRYRATGNAVLVGGDPVDVPAVTKTGEARDVALSLTDVSEIGGARYVLAVIRDVTAQKTAERALGATNIAMREFVATASHDLRTPLTSVLGFARYLSDHFDTVSVEQRQEFLDAIIRGAAHAARLVDDLLTLSQIQAGVLASRRQRVSVAHAAREASSRARSAAELTVDESIAVDVDPDHLERILVNYLTNADRYGAPPVRVSAARAGNTVDVRVCDAGAGVPDAFIERLFTSFARADPTAGDGTGLGLAIVKGLAAANDGEAFYEQSADDGCCFGVTLPAAAE